MSEKFELKEIVMRLVGPVYPAGSTHLDGPRFQNLEILTALVDELLTDIDRIACENKDRQEFSRKRAGEHCAQFLDKIGIKG